MSCELKLGDTGVTSCNPKSEDVTGLLFQKTYKDSVRNYLDGALIGNVGYINSLINSVDEDVKLFPFMNLTEVTNVRDAVAFYTDNTGEDHDPIEQPRKFTAEVINGASPTLLKELEAMESTQMSSYHIDVAGAIEGISTVADQLNGYEIVEGSLKFSWVAKVQNGKSAHIMAIFTMAKTVKDKNIAMFEDAQIADDMLNVKGLVPFSLVDVSNVIATKVITLTAQTVYGAVGNKATFEGLVTGDFTATLNGTAETVTVAEVGDGVYTVTYTTVAIATDIVTIQVAKTGFNFALLTYTLVV